MIKNVVFDVGMVLVNFRWHDYMLDQGFPEEVIEILGQKMVMSDFWKDLDRGTKSEKDAPAFFKSLMPEYSREIDLFWKNIADIVWEFDYAKPMIERLKLAGYKVYLLSNYPKAMAELHWPVFSFIDDVDGKVISAFEKQVKPEPYIYETMLKRYNLKAEECIFLDDREDNILTARKLDMKGIVFTGYEDAVKELEGYGVKF